MDRLIQAVLVAAGILLVAVNIYMGYSLVTYESPP